MLYYVDCEQTQRNGANCVVPTDLHHDTITGINTRVHDTRLSDMAHSMHVDEGLQRLVVIGGTDGVQYYTDMFVYDLSMCYLC